MGIILGLRLKRHDNPSVSGPLSKLFNFLTKMIVFKLNKSLNRILEVIILIAIY